MSAQVLNFPGHMGRPPTGGGDQSPSDIHLIFHAKGAFSILRQAEKLLAEAEGIDRSRSSVEQVAVRLHVAADALEKGIAAYRVEARREFIATVLESLSGPEATMAHIAGARNMLETILDALPKLPGGE